MQPAAVTATYPESKVVHQNFPKGISMRAMVRCEVCGVERLRLGAHIKAAHSFTVGQYRNQFPDALVEVEGSRARSPECRARQSKAASKRWADPKARAEQSARLRDSAPWAGKTLSPEHRAAISEGGQGQTHDLTDEYRKVLADRGRRVLTDLRQQPDYRDKLSEGQRRRAIREGSTFGLRDAGRQAKSLQTRIVNGTLIPPGAGRGITGFRKGIPHYCRSTLEANFARILAYRGVPYEYEPQVFMLPGGVRWTPDFRLLAPLGDIPAGWVELKGWRKNDGCLPGDVSEKIAIFEQMTGESVYILVQSSPEWLALQAMYAELVAWERPRFNLKTHPDVFSRT